MNGRSALTMDDLTPILFGAAAFQYLNAGSKLGLFELLRENPALTKEQVRRKLGLEERSADVLLLGTTSLRLTELHDDGYRNAGVVDRMFDSDMWTIFRDVVDFEADIVYEGQADLVESLRTNTNVGLRRISGSGRDLYFRLAENPELQKVFYRYMSSWSELSNSLLLDRVDFSETMSLLDVGGGDGVNAVALAKAHDHLAVHILEISTNAPITRRNIAAEGLTDRITVHTCDMFDDPFPGGHDCVLFAHQLVIWTPEENIALLRKAREALVPGGRVVIFNSMSNEDGDGPLMAALDSVYFAALPAEGGMIYGWHQYEEWLTEAGFQDISRVPFDGWTPHGAVIARR
jgi:ubiquinone/menaquinone biosynthesis C-methylase UbiE